MELTISSIGKFCSRLNFEKNSCEIDLREVTFFSPFGLLYLGMFLRNYCARGIGFTVLLPDNGKAREYLARQQFWKRFNFDEESIAQESPLRFTTGTSLNDIIDIKKHDYIGEEIGDMVRGVLLQNGCYSAPDKIANMIAELVDNFAQHARRQFAALALQYYPSLQILRVALADCGVGIRASLSENPQHRWLLNRPHHIAAIEALTPGVSRKHEGGIGFLDILNGVDDLSGVLFLATGDEYIRVRRRKVTHGPMHFDLSGVQIELRLPVGSLFA